MSNICNVHLDCKLIYKMRIIYLKLSFVYFNKLKIKIYFSKVKINESYTLKVFFMISIYLKWIKNIDFYNKLKNTNY